MAHGSGMERKGKFSTKKCCMKNKLLYKDPAAWRGEKKQQLSQDRTEGKVTQPVSQGPRIRNLESGTPACL